ncbi:cyclic pyranopterin monophosphate synthase subunit MoaA [Paraoerskovia marina]|uniref:GTP 3',8-cyclase n=1 Tax=Paraoerskovia marina TaxID=545619 RepID=A0A1H1UU33_9CELL|nr:GTP 3',8-cyclase MoaA [Paraoerskovia marina]SDS76052.1 cyclic pyranopterin monophosphate synthase subunit MoaA [Paraoerskovia marina]
MPAVSLGTPQVRTAVSPDGRPDTDLLVDRFGRVARDLRISVTEKCSLRCTYCMPAEGLPAIAADQLLTPDEIGRLVGIATARFGVHDIRLTGGEPLVRREIVEIVSRVRAAAPDASVSMTTNAIGLDKRVHALVEAGLDRVNISLDSVDRQHFAELTRRDRLPAVLTGIRGAIDAGLSPVKLNAVLMPETLRGARDLLAFAVEHDCRLRFIEQMPLDADHQWAREHMVTAETLLAELGRQFTLEPLGRDDPSAPAEEWRVDGGSSTVGIIASVTRSFCGDCDRTRLTAEGTVRSCLFGDAETDLRGLLRGGGSDDDIAAAWQGAMWAKPWSHGFDTGAPDPETFAPTTRSMGAIGG